MRYLLAFFYLSVLAVGFIGGWVLRTGLRQHSPTVRVVRWMVVLFPLALAASVALKPYGPSFWLARLPNPTVWDKAALYSVALLVVVRGIWEVVLVVVHWSRLAHEGIHGGSLMEADWLDYTTLSQRVKLQSPPEIRFHKGFQNPVVVGWRDPIVLFPARLVPMALRASDPFWMDVEAAGEDKASLRGKIVHELEHVVQRDHLKLWLLALTGCVVPWEWIVGRTDLEKSTVTSNVVFQGISKAFRVLGKPYRWGLEAERKVQEDGADSKLLHVLEDGREVLARIRPGAPTFVKQTSRLFEDWREIGLALGCCSLFYLAPGVGVVRFALGGKMDTLHALPPTWALYLKPGYGKGTAGALPGTGVMPGRIVANIEEVVPGHEPQLKGIGRFRPEDLPDQGWVELQWEIISEDNVPEAKDAHLLFAVVPMVENSNQEAMTVRADPSSMPEDLGGHRYRFRRRINLEVLRPKPSWIYVDYYFQDHGRWIFYPPVIEIVSPSGDRRPFPTS